jgi:type I restriction enzyme S subunit
MGSEEQTPLETKGWLYYPPFPDHWERTPLYSLAKWVNGLAFRDTQFSPVGKPVIKIAEIKSGISPQTKFTEQSFDDAVRIRPGDLLFSWSGQPETSIDAFWWRGPEGWLNQHVFRVLPKNGIEPGFFYYLLRYLKPNFVAIARNKQTTGLGHVTKRDIEAIEAACPEETEQRAIAHILGTLDDKIELNRRRNQTLEAMARALFKDWFVDFGPVRAKMEGREPYLPADLWQLFPTASMKGGIRSGGLCSRLANF